MTDITFINTEMDDDSRVETGAVQFDDDWPGTFIRGDNSFAYIQALKSFLAHYPQTDDEHITAHISRRQLEGLITVLEECIKK